MAKKYKTHESWVLVGLVVMTLLFLWAYVIRANRVDEMENASFQSRAANKVQEVKQVKTAVKKLVH